MPAAHRYQLSVKVNGAHLTPTPLGLPSVALSRLTLSFKGATSVDQNALDAWRNDGNLGSNLNCALQVRPTLKVEGVERTPAVTPAAVGVCTENNTLELQLTLPELAPGDCGSVPASAACINKVAYYNIGASNLHALQAYAFQASDALLTARADKLLQAVRAQTNPNANPEDTVGEFLHLVGLKYMRHITDANWRVGQLDGGTGHSGNHLGLTSSRMKVAYLFDLPFAVNRTGFLVDVPGGVSRNVDLATGAPAWKTFILSGYAASAYEHFVWQENSRLDAVSTVRGLQYANETGVGTVTVDSGNWASVRSQLLVYPGASVSDCAYDPATLQYPRCVVDDPVRSGSIQSLINLGYTITLPKSLIQYGSFKGHVCEAKRQTANPADPACSSAYCATYAIGPYAGGYTIGLPISHSLDGALDSGWQGGATTPAAVNPSGMPPVMVGGGLIGRGCLGFRPGSAIRSIW